MAKNKTLAAITTRARLLQKKSKSLTWIGAIQKASQEVRKEGKIGKAKAKPKTKAKRVRQTGTSDRKRDMERSAQPPGKRVIKTGRGKSHAIYEYRKNRSDIPGKLTGTNMYDHRDRIERQIKETIATIDRIKEATLPKQQKKSSLANQRRYLTTLKRQLREQNSHINRSLR